MLAVAILLAACGSSEPVAAGDIDIAAAQAASQAGEFGCVDNYEPLFSAAADAGFEYNGEFYDPLKTTICGSNSGDLYLYGENLTTGEVIVLPACQETSTSWLATDFDATYRLTDTAADNSDIAGSFVQTFPNQEWRQWNLRIDVVRDVEAQADPANHRCP